MTPITQHSASTVKTGKPIAAKSAPFTSNTSVLPKDQPAAKSQTKSRKPTTGLVASNTASAKAAQAKVPQQVQTGASSLDFILQEPVIDKRNYEMTIIDGSQNGWGMVVRYKVVTDLGRDKNIEVLKIMARKEKYSKTESESIAKVMARFCARWPFPIGGSDIKFKSNLFAVISFELFPSKGFDLRDIRLKKKRYNFHVSIIDPTTGEMVDEETSLTPEEFKTLKKPIPSLPKYVSCSDDESKLGDMKVAGNRNAVKFIKFVAWSFHGKIISSDSFQQAYADLQHEYTGNYGFRVGNIKNVATNKKSAKATVSTSQSSTLPQKIFAIRRHTRDDRVSILPAPHFLQEVNKQLEDILLRSLSRGRLAFVTEAIDKCQAEDPSSPLKAWRAGVVAADAMNEGVHRGDPPPSRCNCISDQARKVTEHRCLACFQSVLCSTMQPDENGEAVCAKCALKDSRGAKHKNARLATRRLKEALRVLVSKETQYWASSDSKEPGEVKKAAKAMAQATMDELMKAIVNDDEVSQSSLTATNTNST